MISRRTQVWKIRLDWSRNSWDYFRVIEGALIMERNSQAHKIGVFEIDGVIRGSEIAGVGGSLYFARVLIITCFGKVSLKHRHLKMDNTTYSGGYTPTMEPTTLYG